MNESKLLLIKAEHLATILHEGQVDKGGSPYINHPLRVASKLETDEEKVLGLLHDVLEDCDIQPEYLIKNGIPEKFVKKLILLRKIKGENYFFYIDRIKTDLQTINVKLADLDDNMDITRLKEVKPNDLKRISKYRKARAILENAKKEMLQNNE